MAPQTAEVVALDHLQAAEAAVAGAGVTAEGAMRVPSLQDPAVGPQVRYARTHPNTTAPADLKVAEVAALCCRLAAAEAGVQTDCAASTGASVAHAKSHKMRVVIDAVQTRAGRQLKSMLAPRGGCVPPACCPSAPLLLLICLYTVLLLRIGSRLP